MRFTAILALVFLLMGSGSAWAGDEILPDWLHISGWAETMQSVRISEPHDQVTSRARLRLEAEAELDWIYAFASADAEKNWIIDAETEVEMHELWLEHAGDGWDVRVGRQIIIWGKADGVQVTDLISPPDYTESMTRDLDEIRMPVDAMKLRLLGQWFDTELIVIPVFTAAVLPEGDNPWAVSQSVPDSVRISQDAADEPSASLENSEVALKVSAYLPGFDVAASVFHTWDDMPAMHRGAWMEGDTLHVDYRPEHHRLTVLGLECSRPWSDFVFRGEAAYTIGQYQNTDSVFEDPRPKDGLKWLAGLDWMPGDDWSVTGQFVGAHILDYDEGLAEDAFSPLATLNISKKLLNQTLTLSNMLYVDLDDAEVFDRVKADYEIRDGFHVLAGADLFHGDDGQFGRYEDNSQVWIKLKYSF